MVHLKSVIGMVSLGVALSISYSAIVTAGTGNSIGIVQQTKKVTLTSDNTGKGAAAGAVIGGVRDSNNRGASVAKGAVVGGLIGRRAKSSKSAMEYIIKVGPDNLLTVISEQTEMRKGDCVSIQQSGQLAKVSRLEKSKCDSIAAAKPAKTPAPAKTTTSSKSSSSEVCEQAKQEMAGAKTKEALDLAKQKMDALCK